MIVRPKRNGDTRTLFDAEDPIVHTSTPLPTLYSTNRISVRSMVDSYVESYVQNVTLSSTSLDSTSTVLPITFEKGLDIASGGVEWNATVLSKSYSTANKQSPENLVWGIDNTVGKNRILY